MTGDPVELAGDYPTELSPARYFRSSELFRRHAENLVGKHSREIVGSIRIRHVTMPGDFLADLLNRPVEIADVGNRLADHFAVGLDHKAQHTVRARVLRPDTDGHVFGVKTVALNRCSLVHMLLTEEFFDQWSVLSADAVVLLLLHIVLTQRMPHPILWQHDPSKVTVACEDHPKEIEHLALEPIRHLPYPFESWNFGIVSRHIHL